MPSYQGIWAQHGQSSQQRKHTGGHQSQRQIQKNSAHPSLTGADGKILSLMILDQKGFKMHISGGYVYIMKADEIYTKASLGRELYEIRMKIIPLQTNASERRPKNLEGLRASHTRRPKCCTAQQVSGEFP